MRAFTAIPQIVNPNVHVVQRIFNIEEHQKETDEKIELILDKIEEIAPKPQPERYWCWTMCGYRDADITRDTSRVIKMI